jgi:hypothetical protein
VLFDIWFVLDSAIIRVVAFLLVGVLMIVISTLYSKKYDGKMKDELHYKNLK